MSSDACFSSSVDATVIQLGKAKSEISERFIGQTSVVDLTISTILSGGHALLVGVPGLGKTRLVETLGTVMGLASTRVKFTPDLMPADIIGSEILETSLDGKRYFKFIEGPIFSELFMADEINRASPRAQSALLQAMEERQVSVAGETRDLASTFHVLATQNPIEQEGTYSLPEAQLDRFLAQINIGYPDIVTEENILLATTGLVESSAKQIFDTKQLMSVQKLIRRMPVGKRTFTFILSLVRALRPDDQTASHAVKASVAWGPGTRAAQALMLMCRAQALLDGRLAPSIEDVITISDAVLIHRMSLRFSAQAQGASLSKIIRQTIDGLDKAGFEE